MCTVTWLRHEDGYDLFFNRDELDRRAPERAPFRAEADGVPFLAPRDGDHDGTWLLVNHHGITVCLLNDYSDPWQPEGASLHSRGAVVLACAKARQVQDALDLALRQPLERCRPFQMLALAPGQDLQRLRWRGGRVIIDGSPSVQPPLSSSSWQADRVVTARHAAYEHLVGSHEGALRPEHLQSYHESHDPRQGAESVLMRRADAATRSITRVTATRRAIVMHYWPISRLPDAPSTAASHLTLVPAPSDGVAPAAVKVSME